MSSGQASVRVFQGFVHDLLAHEIGAKTPARLLIKWLRLSHGSYLDMEPAAADLPMMFPHVVVPWRPHLASSETEDLRTRTKAANNTRFFQLTSIGLAGTKRKSANLTILTKSPLPLPLPSMLISKQGSKSRTQKKGKDSEKNEQQPFQH